MRCSAVIMGLLHLPAAAALTIALVVAAPARAHDDGQSSAQGGHSGQAHHGDDHEDGHSGQGHDGHGHDGDDHHHGHGHHHDGPADIEQIVGNVSVILQTGQGNTASVEQSAVAHGYHGLDLPNRASIIQDGTDHRAEVRQNGSDNEAAISQFGTANRAEIGQFGTHLGAAVEQMGNNRSVEINQYGQGSGRPVTVRQY